MLPWAPLNAESSSLGTAIQYEEDIIMGMPVIRPGTITREESVGDIIESIALEESAIAHILNAESEKLQAVINLPDATADDLLAINRSVKHTVDAVIQLEMALKAKLEMFQKIICQTT